jgi:glycosyltransferase involved in cell wall biosynthesis
MHGNPLQAINERRSPSTYASYALIEDAVLRRTDRVVFVDAKTASQYVRRYPWLDGYVEVIPNGVDTSLFKPLDKFSAKQKWGFNGTVLLYAGRLEPEKQVSEIVRTFGELGREDCSLVVAGGGRDKPLIEGASTGLNVRFLGSVPRSEMPSLMNAADALIMYSTREGLPATVLEALACGVPVVVTPVGVLPDVVRSGENGFFASSRAELKEAMEKMLRGDFSDRASIRRTILRYSWEELGPRIVQAYARAERHGAPEVPN